jgi:hypothetical protein
MVKLKNIVSITRTWVPKESMINKLMIFEKKILRKIYDSTRTEDG